MGWIDLKDIVVPEKNRKEFNLPQKCFRRTPFLVTLRAGGITAIDIQHMMEAGLRVCQFRMATITRNERLQLLGMLDAAVKLCCDKYGTTTWPVATSIDLPNAAIRTGTFSEEIEEHQIFIENESEIQLTSNPAYKFKCNHEIIYMDDPYTLKEVKVGMEITLNCGHITAFCTKVIDANNITCKVAVGGRLENNTYVCIRGLSHARHPISEKDQTLIDFAKEFSVDVVTLNYARFPATVNKIRKLLVYKNGNKPLILAGICEQQGLDNIEEIVKLVDGIILQRECLSFEITNIHKMPAIQWYIAGLCRQAGKPFFISGNLMEQTLKSGKLSFCDISDISNAFIEGAGFALRNYYNPAITSNALSVLDEFSRTLEPLSDSNDFWRIHEKFKVPVNAAEACSIACALASKMYCASVIILFSKTGRAAIQLAELSPDAMIVAITKDAFVANKLLIYSGICPVVYDVPTKRLWHAEKAARIEFGVNYSIKRNILKYNDNYVTFEKGATSSYNDTISFWHLETEKEATYADCSL